MHKHIEVDVIRGLQRLRVEGLPQRPRFSGGRHIPHQHAVGGLELRPGGEKGHHACEKSRQPDIVGIDIGDQLSRGAGKRGVPRRRYAPMALPLETNARIVQISLDDEGRFVIAAIV